MNNTYSFLVSNDDDPNDRILSLYKDDKFIGRISKELYDHLQNAQTLYPNLSKIFD